MKILVEETDADRQLDKLIQYELYKTMPEPDKYSNTLLDSVGNRFCKEMMEDFYKRTAPLFEMKAHLYQLKSVKIILTKEEAETWLK